MPYNGTKELQINNICFGCNCIEPIYGTTAWNSSECHRILRRYLATIEKGSNVQKFTFCHPFPIFYSSGFNNSNNGLLGVFAHKLTTINTQ